MQDKAANLQHEITKLAGLLGATPISVNEQLIDNNLNISIDQDGHYHWSFWERGKPNFDDVTDNAEDILYWFAESTLFDRASRYAAAHRSPDQDSRVLLFAKEYDLLSELDPAWARRMVRETADKLRRAGLANDVRLLPDIPERGPAPNPG